MKKRLEADLTSIAHRILQLKNKSDINQLYLETQKLYEKLSVLKFVQDNYGDVQPTIGSYSEMEKEVESFYDKETPLAIETETIENNSLPETILEEKVEEAKKEEETVADETSTEELISAEEAEIEDNDIEFHEQEPEIEEDTKHQAEEKTEDTKDFKASFELTEPTEIEEPQKAEAVQISFEDLLGLNYNEPQFVKVEDVATPVENIVFEPIEKVETKIPEPIEVTKKIVEETAPKIVSLNDKFSKGIDIDLNDRIAFIKHLFGNSNEDYNRVMNQLITFDNFYETKRFIEEMVKPDYNNWEGKEEYEERFMDIIEKKFL